MNDYKRKNSCFEDYFNVDGSGVYTDELLKQPNVWDETTQDNFLLQITRDDTIIIEYLVAQCFGDTLLDLLKTLHFPQYLIKKFFDVYKIEQRQHVVDAILSDDFDCFKLTEYITDNFEDGYAFLNGRLANIIDYDEYCVDFKFKLYILHAICMIERKESKYSVMTFIENNMIQYAHEKKNTHYQKIIDKLFEFMLLGKTRNSKNVKQNILNPNNYDDETDKLNIEEALDNFQDSLFKVSMANKLNYLLLDHQYSQICHFQKSSGLPKFVSKRTIYQNTTIDSDVKTKMKDLLNIEAGALKDVYFPGKYRFPLNTEFPNGELNNKIDTDGLLNDSEMLNSNPLSFTSDRWVYDENKFVELRKNQATEMMIEQDESLFNTYKPRIAELFTIRRWKSRQLESLNRNINDQR